MSTESKKIFTENRSIQYSNYLTKDSINDKNFPQEFFSIIALFQEDSNFNLTEIYIHNNRLFITGYNYNKSKQCELMLRFGGKKLIVGRIEFIHQKQGYMTRLYEILKRIRKKYSLDKIIIEQCLTDGSLGWVKKNGFIKMDEYNENYEEP